MAFEDALRDITGALAMTFNPEVALRQKQMQQQQRLAAIDQLSQGIQSGAIDPNLGNQQLRQLGAFPTGPSQLTLDRQAQIAQQQETAKRESSMREELGPIIEKQQKGEMTPEQAQYAALGIMNKYGKTGEAATTIAKPQVQMIQDAQGNFIQVTKPTIGAPVVKPVGVKGQTRPAGGYWASLPAPSKQRIAYLAEREKAGDTSWRSRESPTVVGAVDEYIAAGGDTAGKSASDVVGKQVTLKTEKIADWKFTSGPQGNTIRSLTVADNHMKTLEELADALESGDVKQLNRARNLWLQQFGSPAPTNLEAAGRIVGPEVAKAIIGSGAGTGEERTGFAASISKDLSVGQIKGATTTFRKLFEGQIKGLAKQYKASTGKEDFYKRFDIEEPKSSTTTAGTTDHSSLWK